MQHKWNDLIDLYSDLCDLLFLNIYVDFPFILDKTVALGHN